SFAYPSSLFPSLPGTLSFVVRSSLFHYSCLPSHPPMNSTYSPFSWTWFPSQSTTFDLPILQLLQSLLLLSTEFSLQSLFHLCSLLLELSLLLIPCMDFMPRFLHMSIALIHKLLEQRHGKVFA
ncbi:hypothetical protein PENTCL1PPCAC_10920, partial [Pristionchus entomophagus]